jgi:hypothetical protein
MKKILQSGKNLPHLIKEVKFFCGSAAVAQNNFSESF